MKKWLGPVLVLLLVITGICSVRSQPVRFDHLSLEQGLSQGNMWDVYQDHLGFIWIATEDGLNLYDGYSFTVFRNNPADSTSISNNFINCITEDADGNVWIGTQGGLNFYSRRSNRFEQFVYDENSDNTISNNNVWAVVVDSSNNVWVGTENGLNLFDRHTRTFKHFFHEEGVSASLPNNSVRAILEEDGSGRLWISTNKGLCRFDPEKRTFKNYASDDGLQSDQFNPWAVKRLSTGELLFGGNNGFNLFLPDSIRDNTYKPPVYITKFEIFNKPVPVSGNGTLRENIMLTREITLSHLQNTISFTFTALNYRHPGKNQYRYKMEGFQDEWVEAGAERKASYTNLGPGKYTFHVIASSNDGVWNEEGASIRIIIIPPFWKTWWFGVLIALLVLGAAIMLFNIRLRIVRKSKAEMEEKIWQSTKEVTEQKERLEAQAENMQTLNDQLQAQTNFLQRLNDELQQQREDAETARKEAEEANKAKSVFLATMSHEIRTPMNGVLGMASLLAETSLSPEQKEYTDTIRGSGEALLTVINDILDFSKIESGNMELDNHAFDLRQCIENVMDIFTAKAAQKGLDLVYQIDYQIPAQIISDGHRLRQILLNLIGNAMKFTDRGEIFVGVHLLKMTDDQLELAFQVRDTGIGIPKDKLSRLFKAFSQVDSSTTRKYGGTGLGLVISQRLIELMGGSIAVESEPGVGTSFGFTIRSGVNHESIIQYVNATLTGNEGKKILVVDDNKTNLTILKGQLEHWKLSPTLAFSGTEALQVLEQDHAFDLVITDMQMPDMDGVHLTKQIKTAYASLPVILLSSIGDESKKKHPGLFAAVLSKPVKQQQFSRVLHSVLRREGESAPHEEQKTKQVLSDDFATQYPLRILIAEDNPINQKLLIRVLNKLGYHGIEVANNGLEAVEKFDEKFYDVLLMDVQMPEMDGLEATRMIRLKQYYQPIIISMTANAMQGDREECLKAGMNDYISKPVRLEALVSVLEKWALHLREKVDPSF